MGLNDLTGLYHQTFQPVGRQMLKLPYILIKYQSIKPSETPDMRPYFSQPSENHTDGRQQLQADLVHHALPVRIFLFCSFPITYVVLGLMKE